MVREKGLQLIPGHCDDLVMRLSEEARFVVLGFGARTQVLAPASLCDRVQEEGQAALARPSLTLLAR
jgi:hypothetical protein